MTATEVKNVLITGASSGIGLALVRDYLHQGHKVIAVARNIHNLDALVSEYGQMCIPLSVDLTDKSNCTSAAEKLTNSINYLDVAILNAGTCEYVDVDQLSSEPFDKVMSINWHGTINSFLWVMPFLRRAMGSGKTVNLVAVSSMASVLPMPRSQAYGASKVAIEYLVNSLRVDLANEPIHLSIVRPGFVKTPLTARNDFPMPWLVTTEQAAKKIVRGIEKGSWLIEFPWPMVLLMKLVACLPMRWQVKLLKGLSRA